MRKDNLWLLSMEIGEKFGCHQIQERSFTLFGYQFPLCARCTGILIGELMSLFTPLVGELPKSKFVAISSIMPMALDGITQYIGLQESTNKRRFFSGFLAGVGMVALFKHALTRKDK